jgi:hypothetical protein
VPESHDLHDLLTRDAAPTTAVAVTREALRTLVDELDEAGWALQNQIEEGNAPADDYLWASPEADTCARSAATVRR